jgi:transcriptional regulator with XRE-family HTH domain
MEYNKIEELIKKRGIAKKSLSAMVGKSRYGFDQMIENQTMNVKMLESLSKALGVSISYWWDDDEFFPERKEIAECRREVEFQKKINSALVDQIESLKQKYEVKSKHIG